jgi:hypothetical protein
MDSLTLKPFPGTVTTNNGDVVFTVTLAPPETAVICIGPDRTADGIPYAWLDSYGWATNGYTAAEQSDSDSDGYTAGQEYIAGTDPTNRASVFKFQGALKPDANGAELVFNTVADRKYSVYNCTNLVSGKWELLKDGLSGTGGTVTVSDTNQYSPAFYRLKVVLP